MEEQDLHAAQVLHIILDDEMGMDDFIRVVFFDLDPIDFALADCSIHLIFAVLAHFLGFRIFLEVVEYGLPALPLQFQGILSLGLEGLDDPCRVSVLGERQLHPPIVAHHIRYSLPVLDGLVRSLEIETEGSVPRFHAIDELPADPEVVPCPGTMPIIAGEIPMHDAILAYERFPGILQGNVDKDFNCYLRFFLHARYPSVVDIFP